MKRKIAWSLNSALWGKVKRFLPQRSLSAAGVVHREGERG